MLSPYDTLTWQLLTQPKMFLVMRYLMGTTIYWVKQMELRHLMAGTNTGVVALE